MRLRCTRYFILLPLLLLFAPAVPAAEGDDPYVRLLKSSRAWRKKAIRSPSFISVRCTRKDWAPRRTSTRRYSGTNVPPPRVMRSRKRRLADIEREQAGAEKAKQSAAERAREAAEVKAQQKAEADAKAKQKTETAKQKTDIKAKTEGRRRSRASGKGKGRGRSQGPTYQETGGRSGQARGAPARDSGSGPAR